MSVNILILAAGASNRFKGCKQLATIQGKTMLEHTITRLSSLNKKIYVALGANKDSIMPHLNTSITTIACANWQLGMGHTIAQACEKINLEKSAILIALADQVLIPTSHYLALLQAQITYPNKIIVTTAGDKVMAPAIFPTQYVEQLKGLTGDKGAQKIIKNNLAQCHFVPCQKAQYDIDTQEDYQYLSNKIKNEMEPV
ncbi:nucleotidyltransferase family protein [Litorilituus lipolyticus]|uniref:Nucleotidyltransferase family protein n=1 Tax=Litorilituus lipolyticus TaxID=2491017 RepID=A0A502L7S2_9GAMM|nr:nucleotidyltransferase family protein [Litorilituus lipolyticus]TPH16407.1 nucleotidyltransferase family protein [Litorilituus lipolyticus]